MCRIAGIISENIPAQEMLEKVKLMCSSLEHGGPDDEGIWQHTAPSLVFGHRRLAIIDLTANGHQPMADAGQQAWITFNGEIYNYRELKSELLQLGAQFNSDSDTEVIIQAYLCWGDAAFGKLRGMFAFALFDAIKQQTYLVRDTSGIKPLYYFAQNGNLSFASEVRALNKAGIAVQQDNDWPVRFLAYGHIPEPYTTLKDVYSLTKGHFLKWDHYSGTYQIQAYHIITIGHEQVKDAESARELLKSVLDTTIERQLLADAPIGVFLSGGIDSSLLTLLAYKYKKNDLKTISIFFDEQAFNEQQYQNIIVEKTGIDNHQYLVKQTDFNESLARIIHDMDMPTTDGVNSWFISKYARRDGLKAVISGLGGDELFGGYPSFKRIKYLKYIRLIPSSVLYLISRISSGRMKRLSLLTHKNPLADYLFLRGLFVPADIAKILELELQQVLAILFKDKPDISNLSEIEKAAWFETNLYMQNQLLRDTDVMSMAHGLEVRVPLLDEDFASAVESIIPALRFDNPTPKHLLTSSFANLLPKEIWDRKKMGFSFPLQQWMSEHNEIGRAEFYNNQQAKSLINEFKSGNIHWSKAFALYQLQSAGALSAKNRQKKVMLLSLQTFSSTGGIQKMTRTMANVLQQIAVKKNWKFSLWSGYDHDSHVDSKHINPDNFKGFNKNRRTFALNAVKQGIQADTVILSHINLAMVGLLIKKVNPQCRVWLVAHGIEVWRPLSGVKKALLSNCDKIICVSNFTKQKMIELHNVDATKCVVLNNALDASIVPPTNFIKPNYLLERYGLKIDDKIIFTLTRLASTEQYKGYEHVIKSVSHLKDQFPNIKYILSGKYDEREAERITTLINRYDVADQVIITGFVDKEELEDHFLLADLFVLPSKKEGFGIVFIEALACGLPVICGNEDGSQDAIRNGELGIAINVESIAELKEAMVPYLLQPLTPTQRKAIQQKCLQYFNNADYQSKIEELLAA